MRKLANANFINFYLLSKILFVFTFGFEFYTFLKILFIFEFYIFLSVFKNFICFYVYF